MRLLLIGSLSLLLAAPALAQPGHNGRQGKWRKRMLKQFDKNNDGKLNDAERREMRAAMRQRRQRMLKKFDKNNNGRLDRDERMAMRSMRRNRRQKMLKKFDTNRDGKLDRSERRALRTNRRAKRAVSRFDGLLKKFDRNKDGKLSWAEIKPKAAGRVRQLRRRFSRSDANKDGIVDRAEFIKAAHRINRRGGKRGKRGGPPGMTPKR